MTGGLQPGRPPCACLSLTEHMDKALTWHAMWSAMLCNYESCSALDFIEVQVESDAGLVSGRHVAIGINTDSASGCAR
jgi:hypothetical protein